MERDIILNRLLDKYEKSKHLKEPGTSNRRVMLQTDKKDLPEYQYENATIRDKFNESARLLEQQGFVSVKWVPERPVIHQISLNLDVVQKAYALVGRQHPVQSVSDYCSIIETALKQVNSPWILEWGTSVCSQMRSSLSLPAVCKQGSEYLKGLLRAFGYYDTLRGCSITMRTFSSVCYHDTKRFERDYRDNFLKIAESFHPDLHEICSQQALSPKEQLAVMGIYARPELYELSGRFCAQTNLGTTDFSAFAPTGIAMPSTAVDDILSFNLQEISTVIFIENKTNYDEYLLSQTVTNELVFFHGGFFSPQKGKLIRKLAEAASNDTKFYFWGDIDLGGFQMFKRLAALIPGLTPLKMSAGDVELYASVGLKRSDEYLSRLKTALLNHEYPMFEPAIEKILQYGVTIEQEIYLLAEHSGINRVTF